MTQPPPVGARDTKPRRVLIVDDNVDASDLLAEFLRQAGHTVTIANDPLDALEVAAREEPEVAVLDIGLPRIDGYQLAARLRATDAGAKCCLIAVTGYGQPEDHERSRGAGFDCHLVKPVDLDLLLRTVASAQRA
jgi:CheY-like chemotaxis protein